MYEKRKNIWGTLAVALVTALTMASCLGDNDDDVVYTHDAAITSFTLGTLNNYVYVTSSTGTDSLVKTTVTGSNYKFYIDQVGREIFNADSLPYGTDVEHVLCTIGSRGAGIITIESMTSDSLTYYSTSDSIDFSQPRKVYVYSSVGTDAVAYHITVNVHQEQPDVFNWSLVSEDAGTTPFGITSYRDLVRFGDDIVTLNNGVVYKATAWSAMPTWEKMADVPGIKRILGGSPHRLYAFTDEGKLVSSQPSTWASDGVAWQEETLEAGNADWMPDADVRLVCQSSQMNADTYHLVLIGRNSHINTTDNVMVWGKTEEDGADSEQGEWFYYTRSAENQYFLPPLNNLQATVYDDGILALGTTDDGELSTLYLSRDKGITWHETSLVSLPDGFAPTGQAFSMVSDSSHYLWIADGTTGQTWRGRLNRLGWTDPVKAITE